MPTKSNMDLISTEESNNDAHSTPLPQTKDVTKEKSYWNSFYAKFDQQVPSQFCVLTAVEVDRNRPIVEFGCGNGRDSIYLASQGFTVSACDLSKEAIEHNLSTLKTHKVSSDSLEFSVVDATNREQVQQILDHARSRGGTNNITVYSRFFLHSIDKDQEDLFLDALCTALAVGDTLYFEFRSKMDEALPKEHGKDHYRRYIDTPALLRRLEDRKCSIFYDVTGRGMAKYKNEDPIVSRIMARKD